jgi:hypothetical protein
MRDSTTVRNKALKDVRQIDLNDLPEDAKAEALAQVERHRARSAETKRVLAALAEAKAIRRGTPGSPYPAGEGVGPNARGEVEVVKSPKRKSATEHDVSDGKPRRRAYGFSGVPLVTTNPESGEEHELR